MNNQILDFYLNERAPNKSCLMAIRDLILDQNTGISETIKYGMPCFTFRSKAICYLWIDKKLNRPYILIVDGNELEHPSLKSGNRKRMKILDIDPEVDLPVKTIKEIIGMAINLRNGH